MVPRSNASSLTTVLKIGNETIISVKAGNPPTHYLFEPNTTFFSFLNLTNGRMFSTNNLLYLTIKKIIHKIVLEVCQFQSAHQLHAKKGALRKMKR